VAAAIARAGGPVIQSESDAKAPIGLGEAVETSGSELQRVVFAVRGDEARDAFQGAISACGL
jgi:O-acetyl-ADP-ribose deacetylase (regulator of RNase III)